MEFIIAYMLPNENETHFIYKELINKSAAEVSDYAYKISREKHADWVAVYRLDEDL